jgi:hypothetical protein
MPMMDYFYGFAVVVLVVFGEWPVLQDELK